MAPNPAISTNNNVKTSGVEFDHIESTLGRAKLRLALPPQEVMTYVQICTRLGDAWLRTPCPLADKRDYQMPTVPGVVWTGGYGDSWVKSPPDAETDFGVFAPFQVHAVAFGAIPVTATVHIAQVKHGGLVEPMAFDWLQAQQQIRAGTDIPGYGTPPIANPGPHDNYFAYPAESSGPVTIRLSDVTVDRVPLRVGDHCETSETTLDLRSPGGYLNADDLAAGKIPAGQPGSFNPLSAHPPTHIGGTIDIPAFRGCKNGDDDMSRLVTTMVSGPGNKVTAENNSTLYPWCETLPTPGRVGSPHNDYLCPPPATAGLRASIPETASSKPVDGVRTTVPQALLDKMTPEARRAVLAALAGKLPE